MNAAISILACLATFLVLALVAVAILPPIGCVFAGGAAFVVAVFVGHWVEEAAE